MGAKLSYADGDMGGRTDRHDEADKSLVIVLRMHPNNHTSSFTSQIHFIELFTSTFRPT